MAIKPYIEIELTAANRTSEHILPNGNEVLEFEITSGTASLHLIDAGGTKSRSYHHRQGMQKENISKYVAIQFETVLGAKIKYLVY